MGQPIRVDASGTFRIIVGILFVLIWSACSNDELESPKLEAAFSIDKDNVMVGNTFQVTNESSGISDATVYAWDFGDGETSAEKEPTHAYASIGSGAYEITLLITDSSGSAQSTESILVVLDNDIEGRKTLREKLSDGQIMVCAHRGNHLVAPENSIGSITDAIEAGLPMIEIDVRESKDGQLVLIHDATIDRTTNGSGEVKDYTLDELLEFNLFNDFGVLTEERMPTLKEILMLTRGKIYIDLDISSKANYNKVYQLVNQYGMLKQVVMYSNDQAQIHQMLALDEDMNAMPRVRNESELNNYTNSNVRVVHYTNDSFNQRLVDMAKAQNWFIFVNAYVNTTDGPEGDNFGQVDKTINLSGNIIQTDYPIAIKEYL